jgi:hypothetical protein
MNQHVYATEYLRLFFAPDRINISFYTPPRLPITVIYTPGNPLIKLKINWKTKRKRGKKKCEIGKHQ